MQQQQKEKSYKGYKQQWENITHELGTKHNIKISNNQT